MGVDMLLKILSAMVVALLPSLAFCAMESSHDKQKYDCGDWRAFSSHKLDLAHPERTSTLRFLDEIGTCAAVENKACGSISHVLSEEDIVLLGQEYLGYRCVYSFGTKGSVAGWVSADEVAILTRVRITSLDKKWAGKWLQIGGDDTLAVNSAGNKLHGKGEAYWPLADPPEDQFPGGPNLGAFEATALPLSNSVVFVDPDDQCSVRMTLVGDAMVVADNHQCGGMNVTFDGVYQRDSRRGDW